MAAPQIPGYRDLRLIGRGGFAEVYAAVQPAFGDRSVAVKVLTIDSLDQGTQDRFERECHAAGRISWHPNVVNVYDAGITDEGRPYLVMEHMQRGTLSDLTTQGGIAWEEAVALTVPMAGALEAAHRAGTLHRDVKPQNIMVGLMDEPKLTDFGIARVEGSSATSSRTMQATLAHAPPEALDGKSSVAGDVYSLASTMFELLAGKPAFVEPDDESITPIIARLVSQPVPDLRIQRVPDEIATVVEQAMQKDPAHRPPTAQAFGEALQRAAEGLGERPVRMVVSVDRVQPTGPVPGAGAAAAAGGAVAASATPTGAGPPVEPGTLPPVEPSATPFDPYAPAPDPEPAPISAPYTPPPLPAVEPEPAPEPSAPASEAAAHDPSATVHLDVADVHAATADAPPEPAAPPVELLPPVESTPPAPPPPEPAPGGHGPYAAPPKQTRGVPKVLLVVGVVVVIALLAGGVFVLLGGDDEGGDGSDDTAEQGDAGTGTSDADTEDTAGLADPASLSAASIPIGEAPLGVAVSDGQVFVADLNADTVTVLDDATGEVVGPLPVAGRPRRVATAADDGVWVTLATTNEVAKVNQDGEGQRLPVGGDPIGVAEGFGSVWVVNGADASLSRISASTQELEQTLPNVAQDPRQVATGEGAVWVSDAEGNAVVRIDPETNAVTDTIALEGEPIGITVGDGSVWVTTSAGNTTVRIDPETNTVTDTFTVGELPVSVAVGAGAAWVADQGGDTVSRIDLASGEVTTIAAGVQPSGVAVGDTSVWVTNMGDGTVSRIDVR
jgi:YVTN family beta-propeller protein